MDTTQSRLCFLLKRSRQHLYLRKRSSQLRIEFSPDLHERHESEHFNDGIKYTRTQSRFSVNPWIWRALPCGAQSDVIHLTAGAFAPNSGHSVTLGQILSAWTHTHLPVLQVTLPNKLLHTNAAALTDRRTSKSTTCFLLCQDRLVFA